MKNLIAFIGGGCLGIIALLLQKTYSVPFLMSWCVIILPCLYGVLLYHMALENAKKRSRI